MVPSHGIDISKTSIRSGKSAGSGIVVARCQESCEFPPPTTIRAERRIPDIPDAVFRRRKYDRACVACKHVRVFPSDDAFVCTRFADLDRVRGLYVPIPAQKARESHERCGPEGRFFEFDDEAAAPSEDEEDEKEEDDSFLFR